MANKGKATVQMVVEEPRHPAHIQLLWDLVQMLADLEIFVRVHYDDLVRAGEETIRAQTAEVDGPGCSFLVEWPGACSDVDRLYAQLNNARHVWAQTAEGRRILEAQARFYGWQTE